MAPTDDLSLSEAIQLALQHHQAGRLAQAERLYRKVLAADPSNADANHLLGVLAHQSGNHEAAVTLIGKALLAVPDMAEAHYNLGIALYALGRPDQAIVSYRRALDINPRYLDACSNLGIALADAGQPEQAATWHRKALALEPQSAEAQYNLGSVLRTLGQLAEATEHFRKALTLQPEHAQAHNNLGTALRELGESERAIASYRRAIDVRPDYPQAHSNLGVALVDIGKFEEAIAVLEKAINLDPGFAEANNNLGNALRTVDRLDEAESNYRKALDIRPGYTEARYNLGGVLREKHEVDEAASCFRAVLEQDPDDTTYGARLELANLGIEELPQRTPQAYMRQFYATKTRALDDDAGERYRGHRLAIDALEAVFSAPAALRVLDAGCGTGQLAGVLRPLAVRLEGVDLSPESLRRASGKGLYDHIEEADLLEYLSEKAGTYDLVVAAAVLIHFGDLEPVFSSVSNALADAGRFLFTTFVSSDRDYGINTFKMYSHSATYVQGLAERTGFRVVRQKEDVHEYHGRRPVRGMIWVVEKT